LNADSHQNTHQNHQTMKTPDLTYNEYYPFYTQNSYGNWKYTKTITSVIHLSNEKGIIIEITYFRKKVSRIELREIKDLIARKQDYSFISYPQISKEFKILITHLNRSLRTLNSIPGYIEDTYGLIKFKKWNTAIKLTYRKWYSLVIEYGDFDEVIIDRKRYSKENKELYGSLKDTELSPLASLTKALDTGTSYQRYDNEKFADDIEFLSRCIFPYFEAPKFIRKKEYKL